MTPQELNRELGNLDLYLLDAILKGYFHAGSKVLDAGCGEGRNLHWFLKNGYNAWGLDQNPSAIQMLRFVANSIKKGYPQERFTTAAVEEIPFPAETFDAVLCNAVLHFALNQEHFEQMWAALCRVLKPGGTLFIRTATDFGMQESELKAGEKGRYLLPDGSYRYLLSEALLKNLIKRHSLEWKEPFKSVLVVGQRSMGVLVLQKTIPELAD